ncbi:GyrI-like domain-containing protein [Alteribacillus sp. HJP-4]|uniref:AraC family transcriptional regulator n=1 Tax=Alteribacillus sp. HJP-4 TaxID=2775394 RepID=UPI0035CD3335
MDSLKEMNEALVYIEENLEDDINFKEVARRARCSEYHFKRMFSFLAGVPLSEYIRRRRLTLAAFDLKDYSMKVIDAALKYGYQSPDAFTRAFQQMHGLTPTQARSDSTTLKAYPPMTFQLSIQGGEEMNYRIVSKDAFKIVGRKKRVTLLYHGVNPEIENMWRNLSKKEQDQIKQLSNIEPAGMINASTNFSEGREDNHGELDHYIGAATTMAAPEVFDQLEVPAMTWAVFEAIGPFPAALQEIWGRIYSEWFPSSGYEHVDGPEILWNAHSDYEAPDFESEIWIPVSKKQ